MTDEQFLVIVGTIYVAPFCNKYVNAILGSVMIIVACAKKLGWL